MLLFVIMLVAIMAAISYFVFRSYAQPRIHFSRLWQYWNDPERYSLWGVKAGERCGEAPFLIPTDGFVAFFWGDRYL